MDKRRLSRYERYELISSIKEFFNDLNYEVDFVVVEGIHDEKTIRLLGYNGPIFRVCSSGLSISMLAEMLLEKFQNGRVAILVDFDDEGERLNQLLIRKLGSKGIKVNQALREKLKTLIIPRGIHSIEGITIIKKWLFED